MTRIWSLTLWIGLLTFPFLLRQQSCTLGQDLLIRQAAYTQNRTQKTLIPEYQLYHFSADSSRLYFRIPYSQLTTRADKKGRTQVSMRVAYMLAENKKTMLDSGGVFLADSSQDLHPTYIEGSFVFRSKNLVGTSLTLTLTDLVSNATAKQTIQVDQGQNWNEQYFLWFDDFTEKPIFSSYLPSAICRTLPGLSLKSEASNIDKLYIKRYKLLKTLPAPPFLTDKNRRLEPVFDTLVILDTKEQHLCSAFDQPAIYRMSPTPAFVEGPESLSRYGTCLFVFGADFPEMHSPEAMLEPLRFLMTATEFKNLESNTEAIEKMTDFWLHLGGNEQRAAELKRRFYERIADSNRFFSSFVEGWRTDRGMIYLMMGPPDGVEQKENLEVWTYKTLQNTYVFRKINTPFCVADWVLDRSETYREQWYSMVQNWREGRIAN